MYIDNDDNDEDDNDGRNAGYSLNKSYMEYTHIQWLFYIYGNMGLCFNY